MKPPHLVDCAKTVTLPDDAGKCERLVQRSRDAHVLSTTENSKEEVFSPQARELRVDNKRVETQGPWLISRCLFTRSAHIFTNGGVSIAAARAAAAVLLG